MSNINLKTLLPKIALVFGVLIIPLMYSYFYLNAFWDPYARLDKVPVAVVNMDEGAKINGEERNLGDEIADKLKEEKTVDFKFTNDMQAKRGVLENKYYASITIPENFSADAATIGEDTEKLHGEIKYSANQKKNYLAAQILENAMPKIKEQVNSKIDKQIVGTLSDKIKSVPPQLEKLDNGLVKINNGAGQLQDGSGQLASGAGTLSNGISTLNGKVPALKSGASKLNEGAIKLGKGMKTLTGNNKALNAGAKKLNKGTGTLKSGLKTYTGGVSQAKTGSSALKKGISDYTGGVDQAKTGAGTLQTGLKEYTGGVDQLAAGAATLNSGLTKTSAGIDQLKSGVDEGKEKIDALATDENLNKIKTGAAGLSGGLQKLDNDFNSDELIEAIKNYDQSDDPQKKAQAMQSIATGLKTVDGTISELSAGSTELKGGVDQLAGGMSLVKTKLAKLQEGLAEVQAGFGSTEKQGTLLNGSAQIAGGLNQLKNNNSALNNGASALSTGLGTLSSNSAALNDGAAQLDSGLGTLKSNNKKLNSGASQLSSGSKTLKNGIAKYTKGVGTAGKGAGQLASGTKQLKSKLPVLASGVGKLDNGGRQLASGANALDTGIHKLKAGVDTASDSVSSAVGKANSQVGKLDGLDDYAKEPVKTETKYVQPVANYGSAFAPYFMGLSLWVGGLLIFFGIYYDYSRRIKLLAMDSKRFLMRSTLFAFISGGQGILLAFVVKTVLGITVNHPWALYGSCILTALTFTAIIQFCIINLNDVGKFLAMLLLILQLTSCAGTFPLETQSVFFRAINPFLPMTYSTQLFKEVISGTLGSNALYSALILMGFAIVFLTLTNVLSRNAIKNDLKELHELREMKVQQSSH